MSLKQTVKAGMEAWGLPVSDGQLARLAQFSQTLLETNKVMNLTAIRDEEGVAVRHLLDSLFLLTCADLRGKKCIDIGCGAGFPSMPLKLYDPALDIVMLDSTAKRIRFIEQAAEGQGLAVTAYAARAEELAQKPEHRAQYDVVMSRAVSELRVLCELCLPYLKVGGLFLAMKIKNEDGEAEARAAEHAIQALGGRLAGSREYTLPGVTPPHQVLLIEKAAPTPAKYPRRYSKIVAQPL